MVYQAPAKDRVRGMEMDIEMGKAIHMAKDTLMGKARDTGKVKSLETATTK